MWEMLIQSKVGVLPASAVWQTCHCWKTHSLVLTWAQCHKTFCGGIVLVSKKWQITAQASEKVLLCKWIQWTNKLKIELRLINLLLLWAHSNFWRNSDIQMYPSKSFMTLSTGEALSTKHNNGFDEILRTPKSPAAIAQKFPRLWVALLGLANRLVIIGLAGLSVTKQLSKASGYQSPWLTTANFFNYPKLCLLSTFCPKLHS